MKFQKLLPFFLMFTLTLSLFSCSDDDEVAPLTSDYAKTVEGTYEDGANTITVTRVGENEIRLSNQSGSFLDADMTVQILGVREEPVTISGVTVNVTIYTMSDSNVTMLSGTILGIEFVNLDITKGAENFDGDRLL